MNLLSRSLGQRKCVPPGAVRVGSSRGGSKASPLGRGSKEGKGFQRRRELSHSVWGGWTGPPVRRQVKGGQARGTERV